MHKTFLKNFLQTDNFIQVLRQYIRKHKEIYKFVKVKGVLFEEILYHSLDHFDFEGDLLWEEGSHGVGKDICLGDVKLSCKCGSISKKGIWKYSGSRTTKHKTIQEKILFLSENHDDLVVSLAEFKKAYHLLVLDSDMIEYGTSGEWIETDKEWKYQNSKLTARISKSMSDQLWYMINLDKIGVNSIYVDDI